MSSVASFLDSYERRARLYPMVIVLLPVVFGVSSWVPTGAELAALGGSAVLVFGAAAFMSQLARDQGAKKEPGLFELWGGKPSIRALSYSGGTFDKRTLARYHQKLGQHDPGLDFPRGADQEAEDLEGAKRAYVSANELLLSRTRDREKFRLVFEENVNYGYRRNLWAMKGTGIATSLFGLVGGLARILKDASQGGGINTVAALLAGLSLSLFVLWLMRIKPDWVRTAANSYARQLVSACEIIEPTQNPE